MITESKYQASNGHTITYIEDPYGVENYIGEKKIIFIFQSLGDEKSSDLNKRYPYTLLNGLKYFNCRKIYIKDDHGLVGDYYLGENGRFDTKNAVLLEFLKEKIIEYKILKKDIITFGFSKGGYAALMFGFELGVGNIITGVPQFNLWHWIENYKPFLDYILPEKYNDGDKFKYDNLLLDVIDRSLNTPEVFILTSNSDNTYEDHIPDLINVLEKNKINFILHKNNEFPVTRHNNVIKASLNDVLLALNWALAEMDLKIKLSTRM